MRLSCAARDRALPARPARRPLQHRGRARLLRRLAVAHRLRRPEPLRPLARRARRSWRSQRSCATARSRRRSCSAARSARSSGPPRSCRSSPRRFCARAGRAPRPSGSPTSSQSLAAIFLPFAIVAPGGVGHSFHAQFARPLQLESLGSAVLIAVHRAAGTTLHVTTSFGSQNVTGPGDACCRSRDDRRRSARARRRLGALRARACDRCAARRPQRRGRRSAPRLRQGVLTAVRDLARAVRPRRRRPARCRGGRAARSGARVDSRVVPAPLLGPHALRADDQSGELLARDLCVVALFVVLAWPELQHEMLGEHRSRLEALQRVRAEID